ncbi:MAG: hypothetical protein ACI8P0_002280 [Planctomycetaceae bacterium]
MSSNELACSSCCRNRTKPTQMQRPANLPNVRLQERFKNLMLGRSRYEYEQFSHAVIDEIIETVGS